MIVIITIVGLLCTDQKHGLQLPESLEERRMRVHYFTKDNVPWWFGIALYTVLVVLACACIPQVWPQVCAWSV